MKYYLLDLFRNSLCLIKEAIFVQICGKISKTCVCTCLRNLAAKMPKRAVLAGKWSFERGLFLFLCFSLHLSGKVLIITHAYNHPDFIDLQCRCFEKFLEDEYEFVVFNDAPPGPMHDAIVQVCDKWSIQSIPIPQEIHAHPQEEPFWAQECSKGSCRHVDGIQYSLDLMGYNFKGKVAFFDSDLFLLKPFSIEKALEKREIVSITRGEFGDGENIMHLWPGLCMLAMDRLPNRETIDFKCGKIGEYLVDSGGYTYYYLKNNRGVKLFSLDKFRQGNIYFQFRHFPLSERLKRYKRLSFGEKEIAWLLKYPEVEVEFYYYAHFMHYGAGRYLNENKSLIVAEYLNAILE